MCREEDSSGWDNTGLVGEKIADGIGSVEYTI